MEKSLAPTPFYYNRKQVKAIVLGADPSNFSNRGERKILTKAFSIGDGDARYFQGILKNLKAIDLGLEDIYVDNLIQDYLEFESSDFKPWKPVTRQNISNCLSRLDAIDKKRKLPVLLTTELLYKVLTITTPISAEHFYQYPERIPIAAEANALNRTVIPFYRLQDYTLLIQKWNPYRLKIMDILASIKRS